MKKLLSVSIMAMLAVSPMMANADPVSNTHGPTHSETANSAASGVVAPFASESITTDDQAGVASAAYVKGAYNAAIRAVNTVAADVASITSDLEDNIDTQIDAAAGNGLTGANGVLNVVGGNGITANADSIEVKAADTTIDVSANGVKVGTITTSNVASTAKAIGGTGYEDTKLSTQGYVDKKVADLDLANTYEAKGAVEAKLDDGANGYDIDAKTLKIQGADVATQTYADNKASAAQTAAEATAAADATSKANAAQAAAEATAAADATTKANAAQAAAETAVQNKLDDGATGYDIDAKTLKIKGADVATESYVETYVEGTVSVAVSEAQLAAAADATTKANAAQAAAIGAAATETQNGVVNSINRATYSTTVTVPMYTAWGSGSTNSTTVATASTTASATYHNTAN